LIFGICTKVFFGAELQPDGVRFRLFAPASATARVAIDRPDETNEPLCMRALGDGWHELVTSAAGAGSLYRFVLADGSCVPDPASRFQPKGVHGSSEVIDPVDFQWSDTAWKGRPWNEAVLYELHVGAFTPEGTFRAAAAKLDYLAGLGVTAIELMCVAAFAGQRSWGYDGVLLFAPDSTYGRPDDLKAFIDAAHARGLMVILDVVYNHFGPEGNSLPKYWPQIFSPTHKTAWGAGLNFDGPGSKQVRELILENATYWIEEFHADGLRLDATHAMIDNSPRHILDELAERVRAASGDRSVHLILESEQTIGRLLTRGADGTEIEYTAQWNHAIDHMLGLAMSGDCQADEHRLHETEELGKALAEGFVAGELNGARPQDATRVPPTAFVSFIQTHDLVGNRVFGERIHALAPPEAVRAVAAIYLLLPQIPMLFMGEEWAATTPFPYFSDYGGRLAEVVRCGRREQLIRTGQLDPKDTGRTPDPQAESTFRSAKLHWRELEEPAHASQTDWYRRILEARRKHIVPLLQSFTQNCGRFRALGPGRLAVEWELAEGSTLSLAANLCAEPVCGFPPASGEALWVEGSLPDADGKCPGKLAAWTTRWSIFRSPVTH
jgi:malto-oligosyltrehalose trehalohydrolase